MKCVVFCMFFTYLPLTVNGQEPKNYAVLQFPYDLENSNSFASITITPTEEVFDSFTLCVSFAVEALKDPYLDQIEIFKLVDQKGSDLVRVVLNVHYENFNSAAFEDHNGHIVGGTKFALSKWMRMCYAIGQSNATIVVDGVEGGNRTRFDPQKENVTFEFGRTLVGMIAEIELFSEILSLDKMLCMTEEGTNKCDIDGDLVSWKNMIWKGDIVSSSTDEVQTEATTHGQTTVKVIDYSEGPLQAQGNVNFFPMHSISFYECMEHCKKLGSRSVRSRTQEEWEKLMMVISNSKFSPKEHIWLSLTLGVRKRPKHWGKSIGGQPGIWWDYFTGKQQENFTIPWWDPVIGPWSYNSECLTMNANSKKWFSSDDCNPHGYKMFCACQNDRSTSGIPRLLLRGVCPHSNLRTRDPLRGLYFTAESNAGHPRDIGFVGGMSSRIDFNRTSNQWTLQDTLSDTTAKTEAKKDTFILGKYNWTILNDDKQCQTDGDLLYKTELKLTGCNQGFIFDKSGNMVNITNDGEFTCNNGQCVSMRDRCDHYPDCDDKSDEIGCNLLNIIEGYNKKVPPFKKEKFSDTPITPVNVDVSMRLLNIVSMDEVENRVEFQFEIILEWKDYRLTYSNLKNETYLNSLTEADINAIWLPLVIYDNTDQKETTRLGWIDEWSTDVTVLREGSFKRSPVEEVDEREIFDGSENRLVMSQTYTHEFLCRYALFKYPFDQQVCSINMTVGGQDKPTMILSPKDLWMEQDNDTNLFRLTDWSLEFRNKSDPSAGIWMKVVMKRKILSEMMTSFLPSLLLLLITFATTFFKSFFFEAALSVNLTIMLVMTTIFVSVMEQMPMTSYPKMIDIWLIICQLVPFIEVIILTVREYVREDPSENEENTNNVQKIGTNGQNAKAPKKSVGWVNILNSIEKRVLPMAVFIVLMMYATVAASFYWEC